MLRRWRRRRDERGAGGVEILILAPVMFALFLTLVSYGLRMHAGRVAEAAAREGAVAEARWDATGTAGDIAANGYLARGEPSIRGSSVSVIRGPAQTTASVRVEVLSFVPWVPGHLEVHATAPTERWAE